MHIIPSLRKGGAERLVLDICRALNGSGETRVLLVLMRDENDYRYLCDGIDVVVTTSRVRPSLRGETFADLDDLSRIIKEFKPDVIHSHLFEAEMLSRWQTHKGIAYFSHCHDNMKQMKSWKWHTLTRKSSLTDFYERRLMLQHYKKCNNRFLAISEDTRNYFYRNLPRALRKNIHLLHNAIDYERFRFLPRTWPLSPPYKLISIGSLVDKKNQLFLVDVMRELSRNGIDAQLDILGDGPNRSKINAAINASGMENRIVLRGNVNNVEDYLKQSHIYVHAATYEPFGLVLLEAMASGLPVVCLDGKGNRDIIEHGKNALMPDQADPGIFSRMVTDLINSQEMYAGISEYACHYAAGFSIQNYISQLLSLYKQYAVR